MKKVIRDLVQQWIKIAERDLIVAKQGLEAEVVITDAVCFHCQQAVEKFLKAFLVNYQVEFSKTHNIMVLINLCATIDISFKDKLLKADLLTDYTVEVRYPDDWYEPTIEETKQAYGIAIEVKEFVLEKLQM
ncbi:MAG: HEPN domain-containing protein [bacterium]